MPCASASGCAALAAYNRSQCRRRSLCSLLSATRWSLSAGDCIWEPSTAFWAAPFAKYYSKYYFAAHEGRRHLKTAVWLSKRIKRPRWHGHLPAKGLSGHCAESFVDIAARQLSPRLQSAGGASVRLFGITSCERSRSAGSSDERKPAAAVLREESRGSPALQAAPAGVVRRSSRELSNSVRNHERPVVSRHFGGQRG